MKIKNRDGVIRGFVAILVVLLGSCGAALAASYNTHSCVPAGVYRVNNTTDEAQNEWATWNANFYPHAIAGTHTVPKASAYDGTNGRGQVTGGTVVEEMPGARGDPFTETEDINPDTPCGTVLRDGTVYVVTQDTEIRSTTGYDSGLSVEAGATAVLYIPPNVTLTSRAEGDRVAGIRLPVRSTLVVCGEGELITQGGTAKGHPAPAGIGCGGKAIDGPDGLPLAGGGPGIGGIGCGADEKDEASMGRLFLLGSLSVTATAGSGPSGESAQAGGDAGVFCASGAPAPTVTAGRAPDCLSDSHWAVRYDVNLLDDDGSVIGRTQATLGMPYPMAVDTPRGRCGLAFDGFTNSVGELAYDANGLRAMSHAYRTVGAENLYAVWRELPPAEKFATIDDTTPPGTILRNGTTYTVVGKPVITGTTNQCALVVEEDATVVIYIPNDAQLAVTGGSVYAEQSAIAGYTGRARAGIRLPPSSTLVVCGESGGELFATGGDAVNAGQAAPYGIGAGGAVADHFKTGSGTGSAAGIGGNGQTAAADSAYQSEMGTLFVIGALRVTAMPGAAGELSEGAGTNGTLYASTDLAPSLVIGGGRKPDDYENSHWAIQYDVTARDPLGGVVETSAATLAMPYPSIQPPFRDNYVFAGFTNLAGRLVLDPHGKGTRNVCTTMSAHDIFAVWLLGVNTTYDPVDYSFDDGEVSLREALDLISIGLARRSLDLPVSVPISPELWNAPGGGELVFKLRDDPLVVAAPTASPIQIDGRLAYARPLVIEGGASRDTSLFRVNGGQALRLQNLTVRNTAGTAEGVVVKTMPGSHLVVSNVLFEAIDAGSKACVCAYGTSRIVQSTFRHCGGMPFTVGEAGEPGLIVESTVVPDPQVGKTLQPVVGEHGAMLACTAPCGVSGGGTVVGSHTDAIDAENFNPVEALCTNVSNVAQYYYRPYIVSDLAKKGAGCLVWHDAAWTNVAWSVTRNDQKTAVFGDEKLAFDLFDRDVRNKPISFYWNTCGSYALGIRLDGIAANQTADQDPRAMLEDDDIVSLREAIVMASLVAPILDQDHACRVQIAESLLAGTGPLVFTVGDHAFAVPSLRSAPLLLDGSQAENRPFVIDGGGSRTNALFEIRKERGLRLQGVTLRNAARATGVGGVAATVDAGGWLLAENCRFEQLAADAADVSCLFADGSGALVQSTWADCTGRPFRIGSDGDRFTLAESTVVPCGDATLAGEVRPGGAVLACTIPCGVTGAGTVLGSYTNAIAAALFTPPAPLDAVVGNVTQCYYRVGLCSGLAAKGEGCFVWHDAGWTNVAWSVLADDEPTPVFGSADEATECFARDVRNVSIAFPWNTRGSYAVGTTASSYAVNTTNDQASADITTDDDVVSLREAVELQCLLSSTCESEASARVTFSFNLLRDAGELVFSMSDEPMPVTACAEHPLLLDGAEAQGRPLVIDSRVPRATPLFAVSPGSAFHLANATVRNMTGLPGCDGLAIAAGADSRMVVENCLFASLAPADGLSCVKTSGSGVIHHSSWADCAGCPLDASDPGRFALVASTVVPQEGTRPVRIQGNGAVLASTVPCGVTGGGTVVGSYTNAITATAFTPTAPQAVAVGSVTQYYYRAGLCSGLARKGEGCFVWHDAAWSNVARSVTRDAETKTAVFGTPDAATVLADADIRNQKVAFPWNTCGSYAIGVSDSSYAVNTTDDQDPTEITTEDGDVSLREAIELQNILSPAPDFGQPDRITFAESLTRGDEELVFALGEPSVPVTAVPEAPIRLDGDAADERPLVIEGRDARTTPLFAVASDAAFRLANTTIRRVTGESGCDGLALTAEANAQLFVSNCLFASVTPADGLSCVKTSGSGAILHSSWYGCTGRPLVTAKPGRFTLAESTVVSGEGTEPIQMYANGAVLASTVPCGVEGTQRVFGSWADAVTAAAFAPPAAQSVAVGKVMQYYYRVGLCSGLARKGEGCFVWHDDSWQNVARSVLADGETPTAVFGSASAATHCVDRDVRGETVAFPWNTRGSYAVGIEADSSTVTQTGDQNPQDIVADDDVVSLRESIALLGILSDAASGRSLAVTISPELAARRGDLVFELMPDYPIAVTSAKAVPLLLSGDIAPGRTVVVNGGGTRTAEMFSVSNGCGFCLGSVVVSGASGAEGCRALAICAEADSLLFVSNCLFSALEPASGVSCVHAVGAGAIGQTSWKDCTGAPATLGGAGGAFTLFESTVVPKDAATLAVAVNAGAAVISCTIPSGVNKNGGGQVIASHVTAISSTHFDPTTVLSTNISPVTQYYYRPSLASGYSFEGKGRFVWHDATWRNVAVSVKRRDDKTTVFGDGSLATKLFALDVRGVPIVFPWNTLGSYAVICHHFPTDVNTTEDPPATKFNYEDDVVSLREAIQNLNLMPGIRRGATGTPNEITFDPALFADGVATFKLPQGQLSVAADVFSAEEPLRIVAPDDGRRILINGEGARRVLSVDAGSSVVLSGLDVINGKGDNGGAVYAKGPLTVERCRFRSNAATAVGGAIYVTSEAPSLTLLDSAFESNTAGGGIGGGAVYVDSEQVRVAGCTFTANTTPSGDGGALHLHCSSANSLASLVNCRFTENAGKNTGAVCARGPVAVEGCEFRGNGNTASGYGGSAIYVGHSATNTFRRCVFAENASAGGGALRANAADGKLVVASCLFEENVSVQSGGAVYAAGRLELDGATFRANRATDSSANGGAVYVGAKAVTIDGCRFEKNVSASGGGALRIVGKGDTVLVTDSTFYGNESEGRDGGAVSLDGSSGNRQITFANCSFFENVAERYGGAIIANGTDLLLANVTLTGNRATVGGGLYDYGSSTYALVNVLATGNAGPNDGKTADVYGYTSSWKVYDAMIRYGGNLVADKTGAWVLVGNAAAESAIFTSNADGEKYCEIANGASQLGRRLKHPGDAPNPSCAATVWHSDDWSYVLCDVYGLSRAGARTKLISNQGLRNVTNTAVRLNSDISGRTFGSDVSPCMGSLWEAADAISGQVTTLADVTDSRDGATSLREILANLSASASWREALYDATLGGYRISFRDGMAGTLRLKGSELIVRGLGGTPVYVTGPTDRPITIDGDGRFRGFNVEAGEALVLTDLTFANCCGTRNGTLDYDGGGVRNAGSLVATNVAFYGCTAGPTNAAPAGWGGAVSTLSGANSRLERVTFAGCAAARGGAVAVRDGGVLTVVDGTFEGNAVKGNDTVAEAYGNAAFVEGAATDALFAQCTFANNAGANHTATDGGAAVYVDNAGILQQATQTSKAVLANCVVVGNGGCDLGTTGRMRLVGVTYGVRAAFGAAATTAGTVWSEDDAAQVKSVPSPASVYAHTLTDGTPMAETVRVGAVDHAVLPLLACAEVPYVRLRATDDWTAAGWATGTAALSGSPLRGASTKVRRAPYWEVDQVGEVGAAGWAGAVTARDTKEAEDPPAPGPQPGAITEATYAALCAAIESAQTLSSDDVVVYVTNGTVGCTIEVPEQLVLSGVRALTIRGPLTLDAKGACRLFSVTAGSTLRLVDVTLEGGDATVYYDDDDGGTGGAVLLFCDDASTSARLEAERCTFAGNRAYWGGAIGALGLSCFETLVDCTFEKGSNAAVSDGYGYGGDGAAIYHDDRNLTITGGTIDPDEIWPKPAYAVTTPQGATALFGADTQDTLEAAYQAAADRAKAAGAGAKVVALSAAAAQGAAAWTGVPVAEVLEEMKPQVSKITLTPTDEGGEVTIAPGNLVPFMTYSIEYAVTPGALGTSAAQSGDKAQADASGHLAAPLKAPAKGTAGFYRVIAE